MMSAGAACATLVGYCEGCRMDGTGNIGQCLLMLLVASCLLAQEVEDSIDEDLYVKEEFLEYELQENGIRDKRSAYFDYPIYNPFYQLTEISSTAPLDTSPPSTTNVSPRTSPTDTSPPSTTNVSPRTSPTDTSPPSTTDVSPRTSPTDTSPPSTTNVSPRTSPTDTSPPSTTDVSPRTSPTDTSPPSTTDVSPRTSPTDTSPPSTTDVSPRTSPTDTSPPSTTDVTSMRSPADTSPPSTTDVTSMRLLTDTSPPSTTDVTSMRLPTDTSPPSTTDVTSMRLPTDTSPPSTTDVTSMTSPTDTSPPSTIDVTTMTSPTDTSPPSTTDVTSMISPTDTSPPSTTDVTSMISPTDTSPPSTTDVTTMTSPTDTSPPSTTDVTSVTSPTDTSPPSTTDVTSMTSPTDTSPPSTTDVSTIISMTLDTSTLSTLSIDTSQACTTSPVSSTSSIGTQPPPIDVSSLQLLLQQASLNLLGPAGGLSVIQALWNYTTLTSAGFQQSEVPLILYLLGNITKNAALANVTFSVDTVNKILFITDQLISDISTGPSASVDKNLGPQLLATFEALFSVMSSTSQSYSLSYKNINLAITVSSCSALEDKKSLKLNSASSISMPGADNDYPPGCIVRLLSMTFRPHNGSFTGQYSSNGDTDYSYYLASDIQTNVMILNNNSVHTVNINLAFTCGNRSCDSTAVCVYWDFSLNAWSSSGCLTQVTHGITNCICNHLTSFSVLMSGFVPENTVDSTILDDITEAGLAISIASLLICISIHVILLTQSIKTAAVYRYVTNLNMSVFLLVSNVSFLSSSFIDPNAQEKLCVAFTFLTHFSLLAFFCWTWVQGLYLVCRLVFVFHHVTKTEFLALSIVLGYLCPLVIAVGTFLVYFPNNYMNDNACWLESRSGASMSFNIPTIIIMCGNVLVLVIVIRKLLRPSISEGHNEDEEVIKKLAKALLFCIPQFGLTWAIGIPLFANPNSMALHYMFAILNPLQGLFLLLFGCLLDKKVMDVIKKRVMKTPSPSSMATTLSSA